MKSQVKTRVKPNRLARLACALFLDERMGPLGIQNSIRFIKKCLVSCYGYHKNVTYDHI